jgi:hypothetical protein
MNIQVLKGFNARKRLSNGTDGGFAPLAIGKYTAKPTEDGHLVIEKSDGNLVYLSLSKLEEHINGGDLLLG